jgi:C-terminal processing protease CtpA/Prc
MINLKPSFLMKPFSKAFFVTLCIISFAGFKISAQEPDFELTDTEKLYGLSLYWKEAAYNFAYFDHVPELNWDSAYREFIPQVLNTGSTYEYYRTLQRFAALLKDGHTYIGMPKSINDDSLRNAPVLLRHINDKIIVSNIIKDMAGQVPPGSEILEVNNTPVMEFVNTEVMPYTFASTRHDLMNRAATWLTLGKKDTEIAFKLRTPSGETKDVTMLRNRPKTADWIIPRPYVPVLEHRKLGNGIDYIALNTFNTDSIVIRFKEVLPELYSSKGVIIDIRKNGGGNGGNASEILKYFTEQKTFLGSSWRTRELRSSYKAWGSHPSARHPEFIKHAKGEAWYIDSSNVVENDITGKKIMAPMVVLIGNSTFSAAEDFLIFLSTIKDRKAVLIGDKTGGSTGQPLIFSLPGGGSGAICTKRDTYPDGRDFVGFGIAPDITIKETVDDFINSRDPVLDKGIEVLGGMVK